MDKVAKFGRQILIVEGLIKEKVGDEGKLAKIGKTKDLIELWKGLIERKSSLKSILWKMEESTSLWT